MTSRLTRVDKTRFGPWAIVTGSSSGIGREFARQLAASGLNLVLVARRLDALENLGHELAGLFGTEYRALGLDLSAEGFLDQLAKSTRDLDIGLVVSNAGAALSYTADMLEHDRDSLHRMVRLNTVAHLDLAHYFGRGLADRGRGGILLVSSLAGLQGAPGLADYAASKAFVLILGESLHIELARVGVTVTVLLPGGTETDMVRSYGVDIDTVKRTMRPLRLMSVNQCVAEGLAALNHNRPTRIAGRSNRIITRLIPRSAMTSLMSSLRDKFAQAVAVQRAA